MIHFSELKRDRRKLLALTGLTLKEFNALLPAFATAYEDQQPSNRTPTGRKRQRQRGGGRHGSLVTLEQKLLFIWVYQKTYPLQVVMGELFGMSPSGAHQWIHRLLPVVRQALGAIGVMPARDGAQFARTERHTNESRNYIIDSTERRRQRPKNPEKQTLFYSGKKKAPTNKNRLIVNTRSKRLGDLSPTGTGKTQDKKMAEREAMAYPKHSVLYKDTAFQAYEPRGLQTRQPKKSPVAKS